LSASGKLNLKLALDKLKGGYSVNLSIFYMSVAYMHLAYMLLGKIHFMKEEV
jgi:hypothetical protein